MANVVFRGTSSSSGAGLGTGLVMLGIVAVVGFAVYLLVLVPGFAAAALMYGGIAAAPASFTAIEWTNFIVDLLWGVGAGFLIGLLRLRWRSKVVEELVAMFASQTGVSATRIGLWVVLVHMLIGALSGALVGFLGLISPFHIFGDAPRVLTGHVLPAASLLTGAGFFNAGGVPPGGGDIYFFFFVIIFVIVVTTILLSALVVPMLSAVAGIIVSGAVSGAAQGGGQVIGSSLLMAIAAILTTKERRPYVPKNESLAAQLARFKHFGIALVAGLRTGLTVGLLNAFVVVACLYFVRARVTAALGPPPSLTLRATTAGLHRFPRDIALSADGATLLLKEEAVGCWDVRGMRESVCPARGTEINASGDEPPWRYVVSDTQIALSYEDTKRQVALPMPPIKRFHTFAWSKAQDVVAVSFEQDVPHLFGVVSFYEARVTLFRSANGEALRTLTDFWDPVNALAFSADGTILATATGWRIKLWHVPTGRLLLDLPGHKARINGLAFSRDGRLLASTGDTVRIWEVTSGRALATAACDYEDRVIFTPDNQLIVGGYETIKRWSLY